MEDTTIMLGNRGHEQLLITLDQYNLRGVALGQRCRISQIESNKELDSTIDLE